MLATSTESWLAPRRLPLLVFHQTYFCLQLCMLTLNDPTGAGPAGLVAAKTLIHAHRPGTFRPTVFDQSNCVGGFWPVDQEGQDGKLNPDMPTNLSKYTVSFSDLAWDSISLEAANENTDSTSKTTKPFTPIFPRAWQVGRYLQAYATKYIPHDCIRLNSKVIRATREKHQNSYHWKVEWQSLLGENGMPTGSDPQAVDGFFPNSGSTAYFDHLVVASGFFSRPHIPKLSGLAPFPGQIIHSSQYRRLTDLTGTGSFPASDHKGSPGKVVVVGGSISGGEVAATIAMHISSAKHSPASKENKLYPDIIHVAPRAFWPTPSLLSANPTEKRDTFNPAPSFLPFDLCLYNLSKYPPGSIKAQLPPALLESAKMFNGFFQRQAGGDQHELAQGQLTIDDYMKEKPPYVAITDRYANFVRNGDISVVLGRAKGLHSAAGHRGALTVTSGSTDLVIDDVACVVFATGFHPYPALEYLPRHVLDSLGYDESCGSVPLLLQKGASSHPSIPELGFTGFYQGPFWGVMEMQARYLAKRWMGELDQSHDVGQPTEELRRLANIPDRSVQFVMGDYLGLMEEFSTLLDIHRRPILDMKDREGPVAPTRYLEASQEPQESDKMLSSLHEMLSGSRSSSLLVARAVVLALQGSWQVSREVKSAISTYPSGKFIGEASFHPRFPTERGFDKEYLYVEDGELTTEQRTILRGSRRYVYRYCEAEDRLSAWFVKPDDNRAVDYFFHDLKFADRESQANGWAASGHHLCVDDDYNARYLFKFRGVTLQDFEIEYHVKGPKKDYVMATQYRRPSAVASIE